MDIQIYDEFGNHVDDGTCLTNPFCNLMHSSKDGIKKCRQFYDKLLPFNSKQKPFTYKCHTGLYGIVVPIIVKGKCVGAMIGSGMKLSNAEYSGQQIQSTDLSKPGLDTPQARECFESLKLLSQHSEEYALDFMKLVAQDIMIYYKMLQDKELLIRKRVSMLNNTYQEKYKDIIGVSAVMKKVFHLLDLIENTEKPVLIEGETGTGKELLAAAIHYNSPRKDKVFIIQNCSAFNDALLTSELFGHEKGSFTGAASEKKGLFQIADGGTLFLDEIGEMNIESQAKLLRILENGSFYRLGGTKLVKVNVRIIAATNRKLEDMVKQGLFRKDLYYRINTLPIFVPPLRNRKEDIIPLVYHFLESYIKMQNLQTKEIDQDVFRMLVAYDWPGNIRELKNVVERLVIMSGEERSLKADLLSTQLKITSFPGLLIKKGLHNSKLKNIIRSVEKEIIENELNKSKWNKTISARNLGMSRASLNIKIEQYGITQGTVIMKTT
ncbi:MAG: sigma 54-interacting transcriptional regulator [Candidatus Scalindua sp.]|nr:sigma 54-interacting transcriptional regulator [Candidatus Scalindua sp.]